MSSVKADWRLGELLDEGDPFGNVVYSSELHFDLRSSEEELLAAFQVVGERERQLYFRGVKCSLRDGGQDCRTCTHSVPQGSPLTALCNIGKDAELICEVFDRRQEDRRAPFVELASSFGPYMELGRLDGACEELLTAAGL